MLSIIATSRNDNHGENMFLRMQSFVDCLQYQCGRWKLRAELILVDWNPPRDKPELCKSLQYIANHPYCNVRFITVPPRIHRRIKNHRKLPLFQYIGKNVGVRHAKGDYILCTNVDVLFSDKLTRYLAGGYLRKGKVYRVDRHDLLKPHPFHRSPSHQIWYAHYNVLRVNGNDLVYHKVGNINLHTNGCGDFTLMHRDHWHHLRGYPEWPMFSMHIDSVLLLETHYSGLKQHVIPHPIYHIEHSGGFTPETNDAMWQRLRDIGLPHFTYVEFCKLADDMAATNKPLRYNTTSWGKYV